MPTYRKATYLLSAVGAVLIIALLGQLDTTSLRASREKKKGIRLTLVDSLTHKQLSPQQMKASELKVVFENPVAGADPKEIEAETDNNAFLVKAQTKKIVVLAAQREIKKLVRDPNHAQWREDMTVSVNLASIKDPP